MNDYETILAMLARASIVPQRISPPMERMGVRTAGYITLEAPLGGVSGYYGFQTTWRFRPDGSLEGIEISE